MLFVASNSPRAGRRGAGGTGAKDLAEEQEVEAKGGVLEQVQACARAHCAVAKQGASALLAIDSWPILRLEGRQRLLPPFAMNHIAGQPRGSTDPAAAFMSVPTALGWE
ncbi:unnamed protein product, partial [Symbiodinium necroappetens]